MKNAVLFNTTLPAIFELEDKLSATPLPPMTDLSYALHGFIPQPFGEGRFALPYPGGYSFAVQTDEKIIPVSLLASRVNAEVKRLLEEDGREAITKAERREIKEKVYAELLPRALHKSKVTICYYDIAKQLLIVDTSSDSVANNVIRLLIKALGTLKTTTIHINNLQHGLQTRLGLYLNEELIDGKDPLQGFAVGTELKMVGGDKEKISFANLDDIQSRAEEILNLMNEGYTVTELALSQSTVSFRLTSNFVLKGIKQLVDSKEDFETAYEQFQHEAGIRTIMISNIVGTLCNMFGYETEVEETTEAA